MVQASKAVTGLPAIRQATVTHTLPPRANSVDWRWLGQPANQMLAPPTHRTEIMIAAARCSSPWGPDGLNSMTMGTTPDDGDDRRDHESG